MSQLVLAEASGSLGDVQRGPVKGRRFRVLLIKAGWGSSGYYGEEVLKRDGPKVWPAGTQSYLDHPSLTETVERPERSVKDLASTIVTDPVWDTAEGGLAAVVEVFPQWTGLLNEEFAKKVGLSIRAYGTAEQGEAEGRTGPIITSLDEGISVDWVTRAGAGGRVLELIESARNAAGGGQPARLQEGRNVGVYMEARIHSHFTGLADDMYGNGRLTRTERIGLSSAIGDGLKSFTGRVEADHPQLYKRDLWDEPEAEADGTVSEAIRRMLREGHGMTANDLSAALSQAVRESYGGNGIYTWIRDNTDDWVVFSVESAQAGDICGLYQQTYTVAEDTQLVTLTGDAVEVSARTTYVPVPTSQDDPEDPADADELAEAKDKNAPGTPPAPATETEGEMPELNEAEARALQEAKDKVERELAEARAELEAERAKVAESGAVTDRLAAMEKDLAESKATNLRLENDRTARGLVAEALKTSGLPELAHSRVTESVCRVLPTVEGGGLDTAKLAEAITAEIKAEATYVAGLAEASGAGTPRGLTATAEPLKESDLDAEIEKALRDVGMTESDAKVATAGR